ncbi:hypothetical protein [Nocardioides albus]|uniref:Uncharacterized protein n=1 Tax=Nocardioides albus TaxID=1841 RepID=A0A7W5A3Y2_9ACTN|nr:hypothetical protein [Nocardioides albus]MBB3089025.1 hypothetical protein [Nocardioides albus]GGU14731.1 hypothetical protein GCM10007979_11620 [Nocardioides albus]
MRDARHLVLEASRANRRLARHRSLLDRQFEQAANLERVCILVEGLTQLLEEEERAENERVGLGPQLRPATARALLALADLVESGDGRTVDLGARAAAGETLAGLVDQIHAVRVRESSDDELFTAGSIVTDIRRCLETPRPVGDGEAVR